MLQQIAAAEAAEMQASLFDRTGWVRFHLVLGRVEVANINSSQTRTKTTGEPAGESYEKLLISADTEVPSLRYERHTADGILSIEVINGKRVEIKRRSTDASTKAPLHFRQIPGSDLVLSVGPDAARNVYRAPSLWHMMLESPGVVRAELAPILEWMQPSWDFDGLIRRAQDDLIRQAQTNPFVTWRTGRRLIAKLDSKSFAERQNSAYQLRRIGVGLLPYLDQLDPLDLSREQEARLQRIRHQLSPKTPDSPERIATWLVEDERAWLAMLAHEELPIRQFAAEHLAKRARNSLDFDPTAEAAVRAEQVARLKKRLLR
jgi:hypothetical protein